MIQFYNPFWLFALFAVAVPIVIHLFNFRRYKTVYFSNVKLLQEIRKKTKRESQLQHLITLLLRILAIIFLVLAFAQPYIPQNKEHFKEGNLISIYVDNSFSMESLSQDGNLFEDAITTAKKVVNAFSFSDEFVLITNDFLGKHVRSFNRDEMIQQLNEIAISPHSRTLKDIVDFKNHILFSSQRETKLSYFLSDFQKSKFDLNYLTNLEGESIFLLPLVAEDENNVAIDSCWFLTPVFKAGQQVSLNVRIYNYSNHEVLKLPLRLNVNDEQKAIAAIDIKANSYTDYQLHYTLSTSGIQRAVLSIEDAPIMFDDQFFFTYKVLPATHVITIHEKANRYLKALYGQDSLFIYNEMDINHINYALFKETELIVLDQIKSISSGLMAELKQFVESGGNLLIFPSLELETNLWKEFLENSLATPSFSTLNRQTIKIGSFNKESSYFKDVFLENQEQISLPVIDLFYSLSGISNHLSEVIIELENRQPLLTATQVGEGNVFLSAVAMDDQFGDAHKHALFFVALHNIGIKSQKQTTPYHIIGRDDFYVINKRSGSAEDIYKAKLRNDGTEFIPEQRRVNNQTHLYFHSQIEKAGFYDISQGDEVIATVAFNYNRSESDLHYPSMTEIEKNIADKGNIKVINANQQTLTKQISQELTGKSFWRWMLLMALLCFLSEILLLRFWGKARMAKD